MSQNDYIKKQSALQKQANDVLGHQEKSNKKARLKNSLLFTGVALIVMSILIGIYVPKIYGYYLDSESKKESQKIENQILRKKAEKLQDNFSNILEQVKRIKVDKTQKNTNEESITKPTNNAKNSCSQNEKDKLELALMQTKRQEELAFREKQTYETNCKIKRSQCEQEAVLEQLDCLEKQKNGISNSLCLKKSCLSCLNIRISNAYVKAKTEYEKASGEYNNYLINCP